MSNSSNILRFPNAPRYASLTMYTFPELEETISRWWRGVAHHMREAGVENVPDFLTTPENLVPHWRSPDLLFSQTCGYPLTTTLKDNVRIIAIPLYEADGCEGSDYSSMIIVHDDLKIENFADLSGHDVAINGYDSHSGYNILKAMVADVASPGEKFFSRTLISYSHAQSILSVRNKEAHCASIDAVTLALIGKYYPDNLKGVRVLCQSPMAPGLPYITRGDCSDEDLMKLQTGLFAALADSDLTPVAEALLIKGATLAQPEEYQRIIDIKQAGAAIDL